MYTNTIEGLRKETGLLTNLIKKKIKAMEKDGWVVSDYSDNETKIYRISDLISTNDSVQILDEKFGAEALRVFLLIDGKRNTNKIKKLANSRNIKKIIKFMLEKKMIKIKENVPVPLSSIRKTTDKIQKETETMALKAEPEEDDYLVAIGKYTKILQKKKQHNVYFKRASCFSTIGWYQKAIEDYSQAIKIKGEHSYYLNRGSLLFKTNDYYNSVKDFTKAIKLKPNDYKAYYNRGLSYSAIHEHEKAIKDFTTAIKKSNSPDVYYYRGFAYEYTDDFSNAKKDYEKAIELNPKHEQAKERLLAVKERIKLREEDDKIITKKEDKQLIEPNTVSTTVTLSDVGGLKELKQTKIAEVLHLLKEEHQEQAEQYGLHFGGGVIFYGPPGCGKSFVTEAIAGEASVNYMKVSIADTLNMYVGNSEKNLHKIFEHARENQPAIIFFDELEALGGSRENIGEHWGKVLIDQFLMEMDQVEKKKERILVIGATNAPWFIDSALKRSGRFSETIFIGPPDADARTEVFKIYAKKIKMLDKIDYNKLSKATEGCSCADIEFICKQAAKNVWLESITKKKQRKATTGDFLIIINDCKKQERFRSIKEWFELMKKYSNSPFFQENYPEVTAKKFAGGMFR